MPSNEFQRKTVYYLIFIVLVAVILILFPSDDSINRYLADKLALDFSSGKFVLPGSDKLPMMTSASIDLVKNLINILEIVLGMALVIAAVRLVILVVNRTVYRDPSQGKVSSLLTTVLSIVVNVVAFFIIFQAQFPTIELAPLFTGSTILGIVVGLALQDTLGNLFSGLALQADQSFQVGDVISVGTLGTGVIEAVSWRGVKIRTFQNKMLVISNSAMGQQAIEVASKNSLSARLVFFTTIYSAAPTNIALRVREAVRTSENVSQKMRPIVRILRLGHDGIDWEIKYWLEDYSKYNDSDAAIRQRVWYVCQREKIDFAYPTRTLYFEQKKGETPAEDIVNTNVEHLNNVTIFAPLSDEEVERLANASTSRVYAPGEPIVRMGQEGNSMFVILSGSVKIQIPENDYQKTVGTLAENDFFGEMSLLTGEPRSANVIAIVETVVLRIDKNALKPIFEANPALVESISELVEERRGSLKSETVEDEPETKSKKKNAMTSIRKFFSLKK